MTTLIFFLLLTVSLLPLAVVIAILAVRNDGRKLDRIKRNPTGQLQYLATVGYRSGRTLESKAGCVSAARLDSRRDDTFLKTPWRIQSNGWSETTAQFTSAERQPRWPRAGIKIRFDLYGVARNRTARTENVRRAHLLSISRTIGRVA